MELTDKQKYVLYKIVNGIRSGETKHVTLGGYAGTGKASTNSSIVYTPFGGKKMGEIRVGDQVSNPDGTIARVIGVYPQGIKDVYKVDFIDGSSTRVTADHLWLFSNSSRKYKSNRNHLGASKKINFRINTTQYLMNRIDIQKCKKRPSYPLIPLTKPVQFTIIGNERRMVIDPYLMGLLLGDGSFRGKNNIIFTNKDEEIIEAIRKTYVINPKKDTIDYVFVGEKGKQLKEHIVKLGLFQKKSHEKFIPKDFLHSSIKNRFKLLQGLMDTDGTIDKKGLCSFCTTSEQMSKDVQWLVRSLGGKATIKEGIGKYRSKKNKDLIICRKKYNIYIQIANRKKLFRISRKKDRASENFNGGNSVLKNRMISIKYDGTEECTCIKVDHPNSLYITDDFIVTHNTTLIKYLTKFFPDFAVCAYTGKAANVLRKKDIEASTIHSLIYVPEIIAGVMVGFELADSLDKNGIIVDEASMVSEEIYEDLLSFDLPMIFVGDHGQLEPIGTDFNLMKKPDFKLEEIHRNAGDIAQFAEHLRKGRESKKFNVDQPDLVNITSKYSITDEILCDVDQVICAFNKTRVALNARIREHLGYKGVLNVGEKIICLRNNKNLALFNGMQGIVRRVYEGNHKKHYIDFEFDNFLYTGIWYDPSVFGQEKPEFSKYAKNTANPFDYANAITCHKAQGDEFDSVLVYEQRCNMWDHWRWAYTAASRARHQLIWVPA